MSRKDRRSRRRGGHGSSVEEVNILPLLDVLFLLLAFFIVLTTTMVVQKGIRVNLAEAEAGERQDEPQKIISVSVSRAGEFFLEKEMLTAEALTESLSARAQTSPEASVELSADRQAEHGAVIAALDAIRKGGLEKVVFNVVPSQ